MVSIKPVFLVFAGAWHVSDQLNLFLTKLNERGYETSTATLATVNNASAGLYDDIDLIRGKMDELFAQDKDVVFAVHSYAGVPGGVALKGQSKDERGAQGLPGGVIGAIWMPGFLPKEGTSTAMMFAGGQRPPWQSPNPETGLSSVIDPRSVFFADVPEPYASEAVNRIVQQSMKAGSDIHPPVGITDSAYDGRRAYIKTLQDKSMPIVAQDAIIQSSGLAWNVKEIDSGHDAFLAKPDELVDLFVGITSEFKPSVPAWCG